MRIRKLTFHQSTFKKLKRALDGYWATNLAADQAANLVIIVKLSDRWLKTKVRGSHSSKTKRASIQALNGAANAEINRAFKKAAYMRRLDEATTDKENRGGLHALSHTAISSIGSTRKNVAGQVDGKYVTQAAIDLARKYDLNDAEIAAIRIYSVGDYKYINPAKERSDAWLKSQMPDVKLMSAAGPAAKGRLEITKAAAEGRMHASMLKKALKRIDDTDAKQVYRGQVLNSADAAKKYVKDQVLAFDYFASTSDDRKVSEAFIETGLDEAQKKGEQKTGILLILEGVAGGKRIADFSENPQESEVLLLPGARYKIDSVTKQAGYIEVRATQTAAGGTKHAK